MKPSRPLYMICGALITGAVFAPITMPALLLVPAAVCLIAALGFDSDGN